MTWTIIEWYAWHRHQVHTVQEEEQKECIHDADSHHSCKHLITDEVFINPWWLEISFETWWGIDEIIINYINLPEIPYLDNLWGIRLKSLSTIPYLDNREQLKVWQKELHFTTVIFKRGGKNTTLKCKMRITRSSAQYYPQEAEECLGSAAWIPMIHA
jgi:hypothetical protein